MVCTFTLQLGRTGASTLKVTYNKQTDTLSFSIPENEPTDPDFIHVEERIPNHIWKMNKDTGLIYYLKITDATKEFGLVWLNGVFTSQLFEVGGGEKLFEQIIEAASRDEEQTQTGLVIPSTEDVLKFK